MADTDLAALKLAVVMRLDSVGQEHSLGHQSRYANRYVLRSDDGMRVEVMFEKDRETPANLWVRQDFVTDLLDGSIPYTISPKSKLRQTRGKGGEMQYGRHSALEKMMQLGGADLVCFALRDITDLDRILAALAMVRRPAAKSA